jgi:long-chain acyl-CoA synthetase
LRLNIIIIHIIEVNNIAEFRNFNEVLMRNFVQYRDVVALEYTNGERTEKMTYRQLSHQVYTVVNYLTTNQFAMGSHIVVWMPNCPEAMWVDLGTTLAGAVVTPLALTTHIDDVIWVLNSQKATHIFVENKEQLALLQAQKSKLPHLQHVIVQAELEIEDEWTVPFYWMMNFPTQISSLGAVHDVKAQQTSAAPFNILYKPKNDTDPTRIDRKGVVLTHGNLLSIVRSLGNRLGLDGENAPKGMRYPFMRSIAEVHERVMGYYTMLYFGKTMVIAEPVTGRSLTAQIEVAAADILCINSQELEGLQAQITEVMHGSTLSRWALLNGTKVSELELAGNPIPWLARKKHNFYRSQREKIKKKYAKTVKTIITYGEPLTEATAHFYNALHWNVLQSFGDTETCGFVTLDDPTDPRPLTAGKALGSLSVEIERYGPIVVKGESVFDSYLNDKKATAAVIDKDGFYQTVSKGHLDALRLVVSPKMSAFSTPKAAETQNIVADTHNIVATTEENQNDTTNDSTNEPTD